MSPLLHRSTTAPITSITDRLVFKARGMERILVPEIEFTGFCDLFIREVCKALQDQGTNDNIDRGIWP